MAYSILRVSQGLGRMIKNNELVAKINKYMGLGSSKWNQNETLMGKSKIVNKYKV